VNYAIIVSGRRLRPDVVFTRWKVAVFLDGCFWHGCPGHGSTPKTRVDYWLPKLAANKARDAEANQLLTQAGWRVVRVWEHEDPDVAVIRVQRALMASQSDEGRTRRPDRSGS